MQSCKADYLRTHPLQYYTNIRAASAILWHIFLSCMPPAKLLPVQSDTHRGDNERQIAIPGARPAAVTATALHRSQPTNSQPTCSISQRRLNPAAAA
ncbi:uncharacterized protein METZ01_LOCUS321413, partial [marine metagenome]